MYPRFSLRAVVAVLLLFSASLSLFADDVITPAGTLPGHNLQDAVILERGSDDPLLVYQQSDQLSVRTLPGDGDSGAALSISGTGGLSSFSSLQVYNRDAYGDILIFTALQNGIPGLFIAEPSGSGLNLPFSGALDVPGRSDDIRDVQVLAYHGSDYCLIWVEGSALYTRVVESGVPGSVIQLSAIDEEVEDYDFGAYLTENGVVHFGAYKAETAAGDILCTLELEKNGSFLSRCITPAENAVASYSSLFAAGKEILFYADSAGVHGNYKEAGSWLSFSSEPIVSGIADFVEASLVNGKIQGIAAGDFGVKGFSINPEEMSNAEPDTQMLSDSVPAGDFHVLFSEMAGALAFVDGEGITRYWSLDQYGIWQPVSASESGGSSEVSIKTLSDGNIIFTTQGVSESFPWLSIQYALAGYSGDRPDGFSIPLVDESFDPEATHTYGDVRLIGDTLVAGVDSTIFIVHVPTREIATLTGSCYTGDTSESSALFVSESETGIDICFFTDPFTVPEGALWGHGNPLTGYTSFARIYDNEQTGIEYQTRGYRLWSGSGSFISGSTEVEVWGARGRINIDIPSVSAAQEAAREFELFAGNKAPVSTYSMITTLGLKPAASYETVTKSSLPDWDGTFPVQTLSENAEYPDLSGDWIVWQEYDGHDYEIMLWTEAEGIRQITDNEVDDLRPRLDAQPEDGVGCIVWYAPESTAAGSLCKIFHYQGGVVEQVTEDDIEKSLPVIQAGKIAFLGKAEDETDWDVFVYTTGDGIQKLTDNDANCSDIRISDSLITWLRYRTADHSGLDCWYGGQIKIVSQDIEVNHPFYSVDGLRIIYNTVVNRTYKLILADINDSLTYSTLKSVSIPIFWGPTSEISIIPKITDQMLVWADYASDHGKTFPNPLMTPAILKANVVHDYKLKYKIVGQNGEYSVDPFYYDTKEYNGAIVATLDSIIENHQQYWQFFDIIDNIVLWFDKNDQIARITQINQEDFSSITYDVGTLCNNYQRSWANINEKYGIFQGEVDKQLELVLLDWIGPDFSLVQKVSGNELTGYTNQNVTVYFEDDPEDAAYGIPSGIDYDTFEYRLDNAPWTPISWANINSNGIDVPAVGNEGTRKLDVRCCDIAGNVSIASTNIFFDLTNPEFDSVSLDYPEGEPVDDGAEDWATSISLIFSATDPGTENVSGIDPDSLQIRYNSVSEWQDYTIGTSITDQAVRSVELRISDFAGNNAISDPILLNIDTTGPTVTDIELRDGSNNIFTGWTNNPAVTATGVAADYLGGLFGEETGVGVDADGWQYRINEGAWESGNAVSVSAEGSSVISFMATDLLGNIGEVLSTQVNIDGNPPVGSIYTAPGDSSPADVVIDGLEYGPEDGAVVVFARDSIVVRNTTILDGGNVTFVCPGTVSFGTGFTVYTGGGYTVTPFYPADVWINDAGFTVYAEVSDAVSGIAAVDFAVVNTGEAAPSSGWAAAAYSAGEDRYSVSGISGERRVWFRVTDNAGNELYLFTEVQADGSIPEISTPGLALWHNTAYTTSATDTGSGVNPATWAYSIDGEAWTPGNSVNPGSDGTFPIEFRVRDYTGNLAQTAPVNVRFDFSAPSFDMVVSPDGMTVGIENVETAPSGTASVSYAYTGDNDSGSGSGSSFSFTVGGTYSVTFTVTDNAGNVTELTQTVDTDLVAPVVTASGTDWLNADSVTASATASDSGSGVDPSTWEYRIEGSPDWQAISGITDPDSEVQSPPISAEGETSVEFRVKDIAGNTGTADTVVRLDRTPPAVSTLVITDAEGDSLPVTGTTVDWTSSASVFLTADFIDLAGSEAGSGLLSLVSGTGSSDWSSLVAGSSLSISAEGQTLCAFGAEDTVGNRVVVTRTVRIDRIAPLISAGSLANTIEADTLTFSVLPSGTDSISGFDSSSLACSVDGTVGPWFPLTTSIDITGLEDGDHTLVIRGFDRAGNSAVSDALTFTRDSSAPEISGISVLNGAVTVDEQAYLPVPSAQLIITVDDGLQMGSEYLIEYSISSTPQLYPVFTSSLISGDDWFISGLNDGLNYLYVQVTDAAGNSSEVFERIIRVDGSTPSAPSVISLSHPRALDVEDAVAVSDAVFRIEPSAAGPAGIASYSYRLLTGSLFAAAEVVEEGIFTGTQLEITGLGDNEADEYYFLAVAAVGNNGNTGPESTYRFRVDTAPPRELTLTSSSHANPEVWYSAAKAAFNWNRPLDFTGVKTFRYILSSTEVLPDPVPEGYTPSADWTATDDTAILVDLAAFSGVSTGELFFAVCAEDFAGNLQFDETSVRFDTLAPVFPTELNCTPQAGTREVLVQWDSPEDERLDGLAYQEIRLGRQLTDGSIEFESIWYYLDKDATTYTFDGLSDQQDTVYAVFLKAVDTAGNEVSTAAGFRLDGQAVDIEIAVPFTTQVEGYTVRGMFAENADLQSAELLLPQVLNAADIDGSLSAVSLENLIFSNGEFISGTSSSGLYTLEAQGFAIAAENISISTGDGFTLTNAEYTVTSLDGGETETYGYPSVRISAAPEYGVFSTAAAVPVTHAFRSRIYPDEEGAYPFDAWKLADYTASGFATESWDLFAAVLDLEEIKSRVNAYRVVDEQPVYQLAIPRAEILSTDAVKKGDISSAYVLEHGSTHYNVSSSYLTEDRIIITDSTLVLPAELSSDTVTVSNFSIGFDGILRQEPGFTVSSFTITHNGLSAVIDSVQIVDGELIVDTGSIETDYDQFDLNGTIITSDGLDFTLQPGFSGFVHQFHGFTVRSDSGVLRTDTLYFSTALIEMPAAFGGQTLELADLEIAMDDYSITHAGTGADSFSLICSYGDNVSVQGYTLYDTGFFADQVELNLPDALGGETVQFNPLQLYSTGAYGTAAAVSSYNDSIGGFPVVDATLIFRGTELGLENASVDLGAEFSPRRLYFNDMGIRESGIIRGGSGSTSLEAEQNGWVYSVLSPRLDESGIHGEAVLPLPARFGSAEIHFPDFTLNAAGGFSAGAVTQSVYFRLHGWVVEGRNISLSESSLVFGDIRIPLYAVMGGGEFSVPDVAFLSDGTVSSSGVGTDTVRFMTTDGFIVEADEAEIDNQRVVIGGIVLLPQALGAAGIDFSRDVTLRADGTIRTPVQESPVSIGIAGWTLDAMDLVIDEEGLLVGGIDLEVPHTGITVTLPDIRFYADGEIKSGGELIESVVFNLFGGALEIRASSIRLDAENGLTMEAAVCLPPLIGNGVIYFDTISISPEGEFDTGEGARLCRFSNGGIDLTLREIRFSENGLTIGEGLLTLSGESSGIQLRAVNFEIRNNGEIRLGGLGFDSFELWGYDVKLNELEFFSDEIFLSGSVTLPDDFFIPELANFEFTVDALRIGLDGTIRDFEARAASEFSFDLFGVWPINVTGLAIDRGILTLDSASLRLPDGFGLEDLAIRGLEIDVAAGSFNFDNLELPGLDPITFGGIDFNFSGIAVSESRGLDFAGLCTLPDILPNGFFGKTLSVSLFQITPEFSLGDLSASMTGLNATIGDGVFAIQDGSLGLEYDGDSLLVTAGGLAILDSRFPIGLGGKVLNIETCKLDPVSGKLTGLAASTGGISCDLFGAVTCNIDLLGLNYTYSSSSFSLDITGNIVLGDQFPEALRGESVAIKEFHVEEDGSISSFAAAFNLPDTIKLFGDIELVGGRLSGAIQNGNSIVYQVAGALRFGSAFPPGIAGESITIDELVFNSNGSIQSISAGTSIDSLELFGDLDIHNPTLTIGEDNGSIRLSVGGSMVLPDSFPDGLAGSEISIGVLTIDSDGTVEALDAELSGINTTLFGGNLGLTNGSISVASAGSDEFIFSVGGTVRLPDALPDALSGMSLTIQDFRVSTKDGLLAFSVGSAIPRSFEIVGGIIGRFTSLRVDDDGVDISGSVYFPESYPEGLAELTIDLNDFAVSWDGTITNIDAGIGSLAIKPAGFIVEITDLAVTESAVTIGSCILQLPSNMDNKRLGVRNAGFDESGRFYGDIIVPAISLDIAGFILALEDPSFNFDKGEIEISRAMVESPDITGNFSFALNGVKIRPSGLVFTGGAFKLPDFSIADGLGFRDIFVDFALEDDSYYVAGGGSVIIPGAGTLRAELSFTDVSSTYPIGLKRAYFSYTLHGLGLPLGSSGLFLSQIRGGLAYGPPDEIPAEVRSMFDEGTRLQLGLTMQDVSYGNIFKGDVDVWVDITDWDWVIDGDVSVINGMASGELTAAVGGGSFYGRLAVQITFVRGQVRVYIFKYQGHTQVNGAAEVQFGLRKGTILDKKIKFLGKTIARIRIPWGDIWLGGIGAEFGVFTNGKKGFLGYVNAPWPWGKIGAFVPSGGGIKFGGISSYEIIMPDTQYSTTSLSFSSVSKAASSRVYVLDDQDLTGSADRYRFIVPEPSSGAAKKVSTFSTSISGTIASKTLGELAEEPVSEVERLIFAIGYAVGDPEVTAISPSGARYSAGHEDVTIGYREWGMFFTVENPEPGTWSVEVGNMLTSDSYTVEVFGKSSNPVLSVTAPAYENTVVSGDVEIAGSADSRTGGPSEVSIFLSEEQGSYLGRDIATVTTAADGTFSYTLDTSTLKDGEYYIYTGVHQSDELPMTKAYAPGSIIVNNSSRALLPVEDLLVADYGDGAVRVSYVDPNGLRSRGYYLKVVAPGEASEEIINIGNLTSITFPGVREEGEYRFSVSAYDDGEQSGPYCAEVSFVVGGTPGTSNQPVVDLGPATVELSIGGEAELECSIRALSAQVSGSANDYVYLQFYAVNEESADSEDGDYTPRKNWINIGSAVENIYVAGASQQVSLYLYAGDECEPGVHEFIVRAVNAGNPELTAEAVLTVTVVYPAPEIIEAEPTEWNNADAVDLTVYGSSFLPGTRLYIGDDELAISEMSETRISAHVPAGVPAGEQLLRAVGPGGQAGEYTVSVLAPDYTILGLKTSLVIAPGGTGEAVYSISGENGFDETIGFSLSEFPAGWSSDFNPAAIGVDETGRLTVGVPADTTEGSYIFSLVSLGGDELPVTVTVSAAAADPSIASLSLFYAIPGDEVRIYGYGFGDSGTVKIGDTVVTTDEYTGEEITFVLPEGVNSGLITVERDGIVSNGVQLYVANRGFSLNPAEPVIKVQPGESVRTAVHASGYEHAVDLTVRTDESVLSAVLGTSSVVLNGTAYVDIQVAADAPAGNYPVVVTGISGAYEMEAEITIQVGDVFDITTPAQLPDALAGIEYSQMIETENGEEPLTWEVEGTLPSGLSLDRSGRINGMPVSAGNYEFSLVVRDLNQRQAERTFSLTVLENNWAFDLRDAGGTRYNDVLLPADDRQQWSSLPYSDAVSLLTGNDRVFVRTVNDVIALRKSSGEQVFKTGTDVHNAWYVNGALLIHDGESLRALSCANGSELWRRDGILRVETDGSLILAQTADSVLLLSPVGGTLLDSATGVIPEADLIRSSEGNIYGVMGDYLIYISADGITTVLQQEERFVDLAVDAAGYAYITDTDLVLYSNVTGNEHRLQLNGAEAVALSEENVFVAGAGFNCTVDRATLDTVSFGVQGGSHIAGAREALVLADETGIRVVNRYSGRTVWSAEEAVAALAQAGEVLYVLTADGRVIAYNGPTNLTAPVTDLQLTPAVPDGNNGWYRICPDLALEASDAESMVQETWYCLTGEEYTAYTSPVTLPEGEYTLFVYSRDNHGLREQDQIINLRVDETSPVTTIQLNGSVGSDDWYTGNVSLDIEQADTVSGVAEGFYRINGGTWNQVDGEILISDEGWYTVESYAVDRAGNVGDVASVSFGLDITAPVIESRFESEPGIVYVYSDAEDAVSGINKIVYSLNSGETKVYTDPLALTEGSWTLRFRAVDSAGNSSEWLEEELTVESLADAELISNLGFAYYLPGREYVQHVHEGDSLYGFNFNPFNAIAYLPDYLTDAGYIRFNALDGLYRFGDIANFTAEYDIDVYMVLTPLSSADVSGWTLVEENIPIEPQIYFRGGGDVYHLFVRKGERVGIPATRGLLGANLVFITLADTPLVRITAPEADTALSSEGTVEAHGVTLGGEAAGYRWYGSLDGGDDQLLTESGGYLTLPYTAETVPFTLKLEALDSNGEVFGWDRKSYTLENNAVLSLALPLDGTRLAAGETEELLFSCTDMAGKKVGLSRVGWHIEKGWQHINIESADYVSVPQETGVWTLTGRWNETEERVREQSFTMIVTDGPAPVSLAFDAGKSSPPALLCSDGSLFGRQEGGESYGFSSDHTSMLIGYEVLQPHGNGGANREVHRGIRLASGSLFSYRVAPGRYKVEVDAAVAARTTPGALQVNGTLLEFGALHGGKALMAHGELEVEIDDGVLVVSGSPDIILENIMLTPLEEGAPAVETSAALDPGRRILRFTDWIVRPPGSFGNLPGNGSHGMNNGMGE